MAERRGMAAPVEAAEAMVAERRGVAALVNLPIRRRPDRCWKDVAFFEPAKGILVRANRCGASWFG